MIVRMDRHPTAKIKCPLLSPNDDVRIQDYRHLSIGGFNVLRAVRKSRRQAAASSGDKSISASAPAKSRPVQTFSLSGTSRATGEPFLIKMNVTF